MDFGEAKNEGLEFYSIYSVRRVFEERSISGRFAVVRVHRHGRL